MASHAGKEGPQFPAILTGDRRIVLASRNSSGSLHSNSTVPFSAIMAMFDSTTWGGDHNSMAGEVLDEHKLLLH